MRMLNMFNNISLDGYFTDTQSSMTWAHRAPDAETGEFAANNAQGGGTLLFGRVTYDLMSAFWPSQAAMQQMPEVAKGMNAAKKVVASRTLRSPQWQNTTVISGDLVAAVRQLKEESGPGITILGSGQIVAQLTEAGLIDTYQIVVVPVILGAGRTLFEGVTNRPTMTRTASRTFKNGNTALTYTRG